MPNSEIRITVKDLKKKLGSNQALNGISLEFQEKLMHGVIGPEGAGKTTLLRLLLGLLHPDSGSISYQKDESPVSFENLRPQMAYMPQTQSLYSDLSIDEHLDFFRALYGIPREFYLQKRQELLDMTRMLEYANRPAGQLSGGMYKKLGLMCVLLRSPQVLLLDEPTNGVDPISRREFWELLYKLQEQGILIVVTTAYMDEAERCSRVNLLDSGELIASGEPRKLLAQENIQSFDELFLLRSRKQERENAGRS